MHDDQCCCQKRSDPARSTGEFTVSPVPVATRLPVCLVVVVKLVHCRRSVGGPPTGPSQPPARRLCGDRAVSGAWDSGHPSRTHPTRTCAVTHRVGYGSWPAARRRLRRRLNARAQSMRIVLRVVLLDHDRHLDRFDEQVRGGLVRLVEHLQDRPGGSAGGPVARAGARAPAADGGPSPADRGPRPRARWRSPPAPCRAGAAPRSGTAAAGRRRCRADSPRTTARREPGGRSRHSGAAP